MPNEPEKDTVSLTAAAAPMVLGGAFALVLWYFVASESLLDLLNLYDVKNAQSYGVVLLYIVVPTSVLVTMIGTLIYVTKSYRDIAEGKRATSVNVLLWISVIILAAYFAVFMLQLTTETEGDHRLRFIVDHVSFTYLIVFGIFCFADTITCSLLKPDRHKGSVKKRDKAEKKYQYALLSVLAIDLPVLVSVSICLFIEYFSSHHHLLTSVTPAVKNLFLNADEKVVKEASNAFREMFIDGFVTGTISLHVLMSQIIFLVLNLEFLNTRPDLPPKKSGKDKILVAAPLNLVDQQAIEPTPPTTAE